MFNYDRESYSDENLAKILEDNGKVCFYDDSEKLLYHIWETDQGEDNIRGEEYFNYMMDIWEYECDLNKIKGLDVENHEFEEDIDFQEYDGGLCTGYPINAIQFFDGIQPKLFNNDKQAGIEKDTENRFGCGHMGGVDAVVWDKKTLENGDYKTVALVDKGIAKIKDDYKNDHDALAYINKMGWSVLENKEELHQSEKNDIKKIVKRR
ncbi:MAG: hypothetical protein M0R46_09855 [Candidatus Muirbacterium halophilum]|nr:hypothetical protein [Candidatus Muirbacterium halophilum]